MTIPNSIHSCRVLSAFALGTLLTIGCATTPTPVELTNARTAYARASAGPAATLAPADLHKAKAALDQAEQTFSYGDDTERAVDEAYIAERTAQIAEAHAQTIIAEKKGDKATQDFGAKQGEMVKTSQGALAKSREQLAESERGQALQAQEAGSQRAARGEAEKKAAASEQKAAASELKATEANEALAKLAAKEEERGTVITLSGSVLFRSNESALLPAALTSLDQVASALVSQGRNVMVEGYTDSKGSASRNMTLSRLRAESVRGYLVSRGFPTEKIESRGLGSDRPVAENSSTEGRANNRRVEIVIAKAPAKSLSP